MLNAYCLTAREAAEMAGLEPEEMLRIAKNHPSVAVNVDGAWRVDPQALATLRRDAVLPDAA
jgi:hypothetical protein